MLSDNILELLRLEINQNEYDKYIKQLKFDEKNSKSDIVIFNVPNKIIANWIKTKYANKIAHLYEVKTGIKPLVEILEKGLKKEIKQNEVQQNQQNEVLKYTKSTILNPSYKFNNFVVGSSNQFAYSAAKAVAEKLGQVYNPIFIYGPTGVGKTHLLQAIGNYALEKNRSVIYVTVEQFTNDFMYNLRNQTMDRFKEKYRNCDVLLIDDVQFLSDKKQTQEEFFHTFNELHSSKKQIVLSSDKPPKMLGGMEDRMKSRFEWGLIADIGLPELETKIAIIKKKCELDGIMLNTEIINYIASNMGENIREIESAIINLNAYGSLMRQEITIDFAKNVLRDYIKEIKENISLEDIVDHISNEFNVKPSEIKSKKRDKNVVEARRVGIYLAKTLTQNSMIHLASYFGMKDHTAVSHNMKKINEILSENSSFKIRVEELRNKIMTKNK